MDITRILTFKGVDSKQNCHCEEAQRADVAIQSYQT